MNANDKRRLHMSLFDGEKTERSNLSPTGFEVNARDVQRTYSLADGITIVSHSEDGCGFNNTHNFIDGNCDEFDLSALMLKDTAEAIDVCVVFSFIKYLLANIDPNSKEFPEVLMLKKRYSNFLNTRFATERPTKINVNDKLKRFDTAEFMTDEDYENYVNYHVEFKRQLRERENSPEQAMIDFENQLHEQYQEIKRERRMRLKEKILGRFSSSSRADRQIKKQTESIMAALTGGVQIEQDEK